MAKAMDIMNTNVITIMKDEDILRHIRELQGQDDVLEKDNLLEILY